jgi:hypothetical protein
MSTATVQTPLSKADIAEAKRIWVEYQRINDLTGLRGQAAGIDPKTGEVWLGKSAVAICVECETEGLNSLLLFERIGFRTYLMKRSPRRLEAR